MRCTRSESTEIPWCKPITSLGWLGSRSSCLDGERTYMPTVSSTYVPLQDPVQWEIVRETISTDSTHKPLPKFWLWPGPIKRYLWEIIPEYGNMNPSRVWFPLRLRESIIFICSSHNTSSVRWHHYYDCHNHSLRVGWRNGGPWNACTW